MTKPVWYHILALSVWALKKAYTVARKPEPRLQISASKAKQAAFPTNPH